GKSPAHFAEVRSGFERGRDRLAQGLSQAGYKVLPSAGAYFLSIDLAASGLAASDQGFALRAVKEAGVAVIPYSAFYAEPNPPPLVRLCFAKSDATLDDAIERLAVARKLFV